MGVTWEGNRVGQGGSSMESKGSQHGGSQTETELCRYCGKGLGLYSENDEKPLKNFQALELAK